MNINLQLWHKRKKELKLSYDALAEMTGYSRRTIIGIFKGETSSPRIDTVQAIERALGLTTETEPTEQLAKDERELLTAYRTLNGTMRAYVLQIVKAAVSTQETTADNKNNNKKIGG